MDEIRHHVDERWMSQMSEEEREEKRKHTLSVLSEGMVLTGGGALLRNLDKRIREETQLPVFITDDPLTTVVLGAGKMLDDLDLLKKISLIWPNVWMNAGSGAPISARQAKPVMSLLRAATSARSSVHCVVLVATATLPCAPCECPRPGVQSAGGGFLSLRRPASSAS